MQCAKSQLLAYAPLIRSLGAWVRCGKRLGSSHQWIAIDRGPLAAANGEPAMAVNKPVPVLIEYTDTSLELPLAT